MSRELESGERTAEKTLADIRDDIAQAGGWITAGIVVATLIAVAFVYMATPYYKSQMIVAAARPMENWQMRPGEAGASGREGRTETSPDFLRFENMAVGPSAAARLLQDEKIQRGLSYDRRFEFSEGKSRWTAEELAEYISQRVRLEPVAGGALQRMVYLHPSREFGVYFLHRLHRVTDDMIRNSARAEAGQRIEYLQRSSDTTRNPDHRRVLTALMLEQERVLMLASIDQPYAAAVVEPPAGSPRPAWPNALLIVPALMLAGAVAGFFLHGLVAVPRGERISYTIRQKSWFRSDSTNSNERHERRERRVLDRNAAE